MEDKKAVISLQENLTCDEHCESCERFFKCHSPIKLKIFDRRRMARARERMAKIKHKVAVCAGKGGVGKSLVTANISTALALRGRKVSILDQDLDGSCIPRMMGVLDKKLIMEKAGIKPVEGKWGIQIVAMANILAEDDTNTWYHELRRSATEEFLAHVQYGERDYLVIDLPPGTSSDAVNLMQYVPDLSGMVVVTNPTGISQIVAKRATIMAIEAGVKVIGIIENMSGFVCPKCKGVMYLLSQGGGEKLARELEVPFLGRIPLDPALSHSSDIGVPFVYSHPDSPASKILQSIVDQVETSVQWKG